LNETVQTFIEMTEKKQFPKIKSELLEMNCTDIAYLLSDIAEEVPEYLPLLFKLLTKELAAQTFVEMDNDLQMVLIKSFNDKELAGILNELYIDDTVDIIEEMPANVVKRIVSNTDSLTRAHINEILKYPKDSAGSIMTIEYVDLKADMTVKDSFAKIRQTGVDKETIYTCYVTDANKVLIGVVSVKDLLLSSYEAKIGDIMETNIIFSVTIEDREEVVTKFKEYGFMALPVVDRENRLVGIVTYDDAMEVMSSESEEDFQKMAAIIPDNVDVPYLKTSSVSLWKSRIPWLMLLMISATITGWIISSFEDALAASIALTAFIPMLMDTGGNCGSQSSVTVIRALSLGDIEFRDILKVLFKEFKVSLLCGVTLAVANFVKIYLVDILLIGTPGVSVEVAFVVCFTLALTIVIAKLIGCSMPILAKRIGLDPAVMASPLITTLVDAISLMIYFLIARSILNL